LVTWAEFESAGPDLAAEGRRLLFELLGVRDAEEWPPRYSSWTMPAG